MAICQLIPLKLWPNTAHNLYFNCNMCVMSNAIQWMNIYFCPHMYSYFPQYLPFESYSIFSFQPKWFGIARNTGLRCTFCVGLLRSSRCPPSLSISLVARLVSERRSPSGPRPAKNTITQPTNIKYKYEYYKFQTSILDLSCTRFSTCVILIWVRLEFWKIPFWGCIQQSISCLV